MIKFRAWDKKTKEYFHIYELWNSGTNPECFNFDGWTDNFGNKGRLKDIVIEQFTGLKDVNGKEIYIGDIIQYSDHFYGYSMGGVTELETEYIGVVVKNNFDLGILINRISNTDAHINHYNAKEFVPFCEFEDPEADVLLKGNVHANPELLEEDE
ncbi:YopX family protein [Lactiplantibacillus plantarum]|uniref:YopX family protein n=1 Tax=Lactiplantibacillus plantarum TaxID=1590 RepID=UPI0028733DB5|nr:YopX family protein [Lactiplantibacillus plantarum]WNC19885.1 YopX family protein [Lactiplantibacillus plantarum]